MESERSFEVDGALAQGEWSIALEAARGAFVSLVEITEDRYPEKRVRIVGKVTQEECFDVPSLVLTVKTDENGCVADFVFNKQGVLVHAAA